MSTSRKTIRRRCRKDLALAMHIAYRKALDSRLSSGMWNFIHICSPDLWSDYTDYVNSKLPASTDAAFSWTDLKSAGLGWTKDPLMGWGKRADALGSAQIQVMRFLIECHSDSDWQNLAAYLGGTAK